MRNKRIKLNRNYITKIYLYGKRGYSVSKICKHFKISIATFYRYLKLFPEFQEQFYKGKHEYQIEQIKLFCLANDMDYEKDYQTFFETPISELFDHSILQQELDELQVLPIDDDFISGKEFDALTEEEKNNLEVERLMQTMVENNPREWSFNP